MTTDTPQNAYDFTFHGIGGDEIRLADYKGKALLVVNTASGCGFTPQYQGLEALWQQRKADGLVVIGVPSNSFNQETGSDKDIREFCDLRFHVTFPMAAKTDVIGNAAHPFFKWIASEAGFLGRPHWNFYKYVIDRQGNFVEWFSNMTKPDNKGLSHAIDQALG
jgi:glutathione peroxidase